MSFLQWGFLFAALAAIIPVVLHMINRQKVKHLPFPTLRFLRISVEKTRRRKRIHDVLLMLIRALVLIVIALGIAEPRLKKLTSFLGGGARSAVVIVLDNSASMGMIDPDRPRFETATAAAEQILGELENGDQVALLLTGGPLVGKDEKLERNQEKVQEVLVQCRERGVSYERADLVVKLRQARRLLATSDAPNKQIYVISDFQAISWEGLKKEENATATEEAPETSEEEQKSRHVPIICVDCNRIPKPNVAVQKVVLDAAVPVVGMPVKATVELLSTSPTVQQRSLELYVDGSKEATTVPAVVQPEERKTCELEFKFQRAGLHRCEVRLAGDDGSKYDDRRFFTMQVDREIPVAIVKPERHEIPYLEDSFYLEQALLPGKSGNWALRTTTLAAGDLATEPLDVYKVIFCVNLPALGDDVAALLSRYVDRGGNLIWICGDAVQPEAYNQMNQQAGGTLLPAPLLNLRAPGPQDQRDSWHISFFDERHKALRPLIDPSNLSIYTSVLVYKHMRLDVGEGTGVRTLAALDDGEPLLVERTLGQGKVLMLATGAHIGWSNLPLRPLFLPLFARLTFNLAASEQTRLELLAGTPLVREFEKETSPVNVELLTPTDETFRLQTQEEPGKTGQVFRYENTHDIGNYVLRLLEASRPTQIGYSLNVDPDEANPAKVDREELEKAFQPAPLVFAEDPDDLTSTFQTLREGKDLWSLFLYGVLIVLVFETFISNRLSPKQDEDQAGQPAAGMGRGGRHRYSPA